ncbi:PEPxxWA-CTERM sorting domain-containing protein [uncultured Rhodoblastus sp.]|uniref:PEPxxWA-CTERM sorting domain-containing protein n=1 Tax=uncultured Rhodoblastus sp. TaxID=543037 RepID=UPI0025F918B3|nr:PEPxxWA-CTERM sorting domain-containing protein [uncultured Rhodoblastus sp.]
MKNVSRLFVAAAAMVAANAAQAKFTINFDENGNGSYSVFSGGFYGPVVNDPGFLAADPTNTFTGNVLTYALPEIINAGGVNILDVSGAISDNLLFYNAGSHGYLIFTSLPGGGALADTGILNLGYNGAVENPNETFRYLAGNGDPSSTNFYNGVSGVPEPSTWAMMLVGFAGFGFAAHRRSVKAASVSA